MVKISPLICNDYAYSCKKSDNDNQSSISFKMNIEALEGPMGLVFDDAIKCLSEKAGAEVVTRVGHRRKSKNAIKMSRVDKEYNQRALDSVMGYRGIYDGYLDKLKRKPDNLSARIQIFWERVVCQISELSTGRTIEMQLSVINPHEAQSSVLFKTIEPLLHMLKVDDKAFNQIHESGSNGRWKRVN